MQPPEEFMKVMNDSIQSTAKELYDTIASIESAIKDSASILLRKKVLTLYLIKTVKQNFYIAEFILIFLLSCGNK